MPAYGSSAKIAWTNVKDKYKVLCEDYRDKSWWQHIPAGAIIYSNGGPNSKYGHAWIAAGDMTGWSVDHKRSGYIDLVEIRLKGWTSYTRTRMGTSLVRSTTRVTAGSRVLRRATGTPRFLRSKMSCSRTTIVRSRTQPCGGLRVACTTLASATEEPAGQVRADVPRQGYGRVQPQACTWHG